MQMKNKTQRKMYKTFTAMQRQNVIDCLFIEDCSCVIRNGDAIRIFRERGIKDLFGLLKTDREFLAGAFVADKVVGKGAAALMVLGGIDRLFADVISSPARMLLEDAGVKVDYTIEVPHISNRTKTGWCPVETLCRDCKTAEECLPLIIDFVEQMK